MIHADASSKADLAPKTIPPEVFDKRAVERGQVRFHDVASRRLENARSRGQKFEAAQASKLEEIASTLQRLKDEIREYQCPHCGALLAERGGNDEHYYEAYYCGYVNTNGCGKRPCPSDPKFPRFEDYGLQFVPLETDADKSWAVCQLEN